MKIPNSSGGTTNVSGFLLFMVGLIDIALIAMFGWLGLVVVVILWAIVLH